MSELDIVIVNWSSGILLKNCLQAIDDSDIDLNTVNIIVVDNNSQDGSQFVDKMRTNLEMVELDYNAGFAKACNIGFYRSTAKYVLFLNPDTEVQAETLRLSISCMDENSHYAIIGAQSLDHGGDILASCANFPKLRYFVYDILGLSKLFPKQFAHSTVISHKRMDYAASGYVDEVTGAFLFCRRSVLEKVGLFDERFFVYFEELDLCYRVHQSGGKIFYNTNLKIMHEGGGSTQNVKSKRLFYELRSRIKYGFKHFPILKAMALMVLTMTLEYVSRFTLLILSRRFREVTELNNAYGMLFTYFIGSSSTDNSG